MLLQILHRDSRWLIDLFQPLTQGQIFRSLKRFVPDYCSILCQSLEVRLHTTYDRSDQISCGTGEQHPNESGNRGVCRRHHALYTIKSTFLFCDTNLLNCHLHCMLNLQENPNILSLENDLFRWITLVCHSGPTSYQNLIHFSPDKRTGQRHIRR